MKHDHSVVVMFALQEVKMSESRTGCYDVGIVLGSESDLPIVRKSGLLETLQMVGVTWKLSCISAHRSPDELSKYCKEALEKDGVKVFIGVAGMAAALPGAIAAETMQLRLVIGVPLASDVLDGLDSLLSMVRMPKGVPVLVAGIGNAGLYNAAIAACQVIALGDETIFLALHDFLEAQDSKKPSRISILTSCNYGTGE